MILYIGSRKITFDYLKPQIYVFFFKVKELSARKVEILVFVLLT